MSASRKFSYTLYDARLEIIMWSMAEPVNTIITVMVGPTTTIEHGMKQEAVEGDYDHHTHIYLST